MTMLAGRFSVLTEIGAGAGGRVFRCLDTVVGDEVAVKVPVSESTASDDPLRDEFLLRAEVSHPSLAAVRGLFEHQGRPALAQEWVPGEPLPAWLARQPSDARPAAIASAAAQLLDALAALHAAEVVHGDLKPEHALVDPSGRLVLIDLDCGTCGWIERFRGTEGFVSGTWGYFAPELQWGATIGPATDLYAAGAVLYAALTGAPPNDPSTGRPLGAIPTAGADPAVETLILGLLSTDPAARAPAARAFLAAALPRPTIGLVGRATELAALARALDRPGFTTVEVVGEGGIGKTTLIRTFLDRRLGALVLHSRCHPSAHVPFLAIEGWMPAIVERLRSAPERRARLGCLASALPRLAPVVGEVEGPATDEAIAGAFVALIAALAAAGPVVLWIDDAQWADAESLPLLGALRRAAPPGVALIVSAREPGRLGEPDVRLALGGLSTSDAEALIARVAPALPAAAATALAQATAGSPFLLTHFGRGEAGRDVGLEDVLHARAERAGPAAAKLLLLVAIAILPVRHADAVAWVGAACDRELSALRRDGLLQVVRADGEPAITPAHDRVREAIQQGATPPARQAAHLHLAGRLRGAAPAYALAHHLSEGGDREGARPHALQAAAEAQARHAWGTAARLYDLARQCGADDADTLVARAECHSQAGDIPAAQAAWAVLFQTPAVADTARIRAAELAFAAGAVDVGRDLIAPMLDRFGLGWPRGHVAWATSTAWWMLRLALWERFGRVRDALAPDEAVRLRVGWALTGALGSCDGLTAVAWGARYRFDALPSADPHRRAEAEALRLSWTGAMGHSRAHLDRLEADALRRLGADADPHVEALLSWGAGYGRFLGGDMAVAVPWLSRALTVWARTGITSWEQEHAGRHLAWACRYAGDFGRMSALADGCVARGRANGNRVHAHETQAGVVSFARLVADAPEATRDEIAHACADLDVPPWFGLRYVADQAGMFEALYDRRLDEAAQRATTLWDSAWLLRQMLHTRVETHLVRLGAAALRDPASTRREARLVRQRLRRWTAPWGRAAVAVADACEAWADGSPTAAARYGDVATAFDTLGMAAHVDVARWHAATLAGDPTAGDAAFAALRARGVARPDRLAPLLVPGPAGR